MSIPDTLRRYLRYTSWPIIAAMATLMVWGVAAVNVAERATGAAGYTTRQSIYACMAAVVFLTATVIPYQKIGRAAYPIFAAVLGLLVLVLFLPEIRNSHRWIDLKIVRVQPSEIGKLAYIIMLAWYLRYRKNYLRLRGFVFPFILTLAPMALILKEPDLGTALLFLPTLYFMLFLAGARLRHLLGIVAVGTVLVLFPMPTATAGDGDSPEKLQYGRVSYAGRRYSIKPAMLAVMHSHQVRRIEGWLLQGDPRLAMDAGYQQRQSKIILGSGGLAGKREAEIPDWYFRFLPDDHTDFIFSVICGQWGFVGGASLLMLYGVIFLFGVEIAVITKDPFGRLLAVGVLAMLFSQVCINVGMTMGLTPITGMTLPFISYGGSSLVINCAAMGLLVNVGQRRPVLLSKRPFEHGRKKEKLTRTEYFSPPGG